MLLRSAGLFLFALQAVLADELSCDFRRHCCWKSLEEDAKWQVRSGRSININEFRRTFLVGRSRQPPVGNYLLQSRNKGQATFGSCSFCSSDGNVNVQYRHWQSPTASLKICWRRWGQNIRSENCHPAEPSRQSQVISQSLVVPRGTNVQVLFVMEKNEGAVNAVVMIDRIFVNVKKCGSNDEEKELLSQAVQIGVRSPLRHTEEKKLRSDSISINVKSHQLAPAKTDLSHLALVDERVRMKLLDREEERKLVRQLLKESSSMKNKEEKQGKVLPQRQEALRKGLSTEKSVSTREVTSSPSLLSPLSMGRVPMKPLKRFVPNMKQLEGKPNVLTPPLPPPSPLAEPEKFDPLTELLGKDLVNFLDPNYVTNDDEEEFDYPDEDTKTTKAMVAVKIATTRPPTQWKPHRIPPSRIAPTVVQTPSPLMLFRSRPLSLVPPQPCNTVGGCLFDRTMCLYKHPQEIPVTSRFTQITVGYSHFVRAQVPPGSSSVLQSETNMLEPHTVFFDALEWKSGTRLIGCCSDRTGTRQCPFATPSEAGILLWQSASFDCPAFTSKISFICENLSTEESECGIDSVRLHRLSDTFLLEPCQKNVLASI